MSDSLSTLMQAGLLAPLSYFFARFVARGNAVPEDSLLGQSAALVSMRNLSGDVCVDLRQFAGAPLFESEDDQGIVVPQGPSLDDWMNGLRGASWVGGPGEETPLVLEGTRLFLGKYWSFETQVASALIARMAPVDGIDQARLAEGLTRLFPASADRAVDWQKVAAAIAVSRRFAVISGGPGTGKTTTVVKVLTLLLEQSPSMRIALAAPTGKAAARLTEAIAKEKVRVDADPELLSRVPTEAKTIHRLLGGVRGNRFRHNRDNPVLLDCLVVDEASMIDLPLMARLVAALPDQTRLILLGDRDQLASVEAGNVLGDITGHGRDIGYSLAQLQFLESTGAAPAGALPGELPHAPLSSVVQDPSITDAIGLLRVSFRFKSDSGIGALARAVNAGCGEDALALFESGLFQDIAWLDAPQDQLNPQCVDWAAQEYTHYLEQSDVGVALERFEHYRVLAAHHRGPFGVDEINRAIAERLRSEKRIQGGEDYHGKPVMVTVNDYEVGLFNGDIGLLWRDGDDGLRAWFRGTDGQLRSVSARQLPQHTCAFALTVHKSQGSEFDEVLLVLPFDRSPLLTRELVYTGITRSRMKLAIQGHRGSFIEGCRHCVQRSSSLSERLGWADAVHARGPLAHRPNNNLS
ncbi:exodeoxyribonuclease V subunit alpha [Thiorhodococcus mannitoliphagus]|uniref:RecBCD enzyme subunit RecD n=1 Tax=Thiorhodococcus mannitoliphagus TaxID=329406 RepID=A0A6P1DSI7_9GAMM|nr:exodeoxyribonuclease V subunit alpha [Thiorhodococcus mannitoliphagus]NEX19891.1 exodeoxyribonuclease V subunit alpha [Thiorhodococcus mannitoliphagus]